MQYIKDGHLVWDAGKIPLKQFKYISFQYLEKILEDNAMAFQNPMNFNDPFDCNYAVYYQKDYDKIRNFLFSTDIYKSGKISQEYLEERANLFYTNHEESINLLNDTVKDHVSNTGVSCFTTEKNNLLMWAHYADKHNGVCLGFDIPKDLKFFATMHPVTYVDEHPKFNYFEKMETSFYEILTTKHKIWSYENEYRIIKKVNEGIYYFDKSCLNDIIFGYNLRLKNSLKQRIIELVKEKSYPNVKFSQAYIMKDKFDLSYEVFD